MRFMSVMLGLLCLPALMLAILLAPLWVPVLFVLALVVPGLTAFRRTSSVRTWSVASYHSPHSLTWRWLFRLSLGRVFSKPMVRLDPRESFMGTKSPFVGFGFSIGIAGAHAYTNNYGWQFAAWLLGAHVQFSQQAPMWYRNLYNREQRDYGDRMQINALVRDEWRDGVSAGAAARQVCRSLGVHGLAPSLKRLLEEMLADQNHASFDRSMILKAFERVDPAAAHDAMMESFHRNNPHVEAVEVAADFMGQTATIQ